MIYICIPVHDEARTLGVLLWKIRRVMAEFGRDYEILVLDDASGDRTPELLERYRRLLPMHPIRREERIGYAPAVEQLLRVTVERSAYPRRDVAVTLQGDFTEDPEDLVAMVKAIEGGADLVAGVPSDNGRVLPRPVRLARRLAPLVLGSAFRTAPVSDPLCGFRAYRVIVLKKALRELKEGGRLIRTEGWGANLELLSKAVPHARRIEERPLRTGLPHRERESRFRTVRHLRGLLPLRRTVWPSPE